VRDKKRKGFFPPYQPPIFLKEKKGL